MNRWRTQFETSTFQVDFQNIKELTKKIVTDNSYTEEMNYEILRLKKVVIYLSNIFDKIDPDLMNVNNLSSIDSYIRNSFNELNNFINNIHRNYLINANNYLSQTIIYAKDLYIAPVGKKMMTETIKAYGDSIDEHLKNIKNTYEIHTETENLKIEIEKFYLELIEGNEDKISIKKNIEEMRLEIEKKYKKINTFYNETLIDGEVNTYSTKSEIAEAKKDIFRNVEAAESKLLEASKELKELKEFHIKIFGNISEENLDNQNNGLETKLNKFLVDFELFFSDSKIKTQNLHEQIESDLEGSTTLGLAKSFNELKKSFEKPVQLWNLLFILAITFILIITVMAPGVNKSEVFYKQFLSLFPLIIPFIWLAMFAGKRRSENNRLKQEYAHKESVAKTYLDYKKQIEQLGLEDKELLIKLLSESINTISFNASSTLDKKHNEKTPYHEFASLLSEKGKELTGVVKKGNK